MLIYYVDVGKKIVEIKIELLSNSFVEKWKDCFKRAYKVAPSLAWRINNHGNTIGDPPEIPYHKKNVIKENLENLLVSFEYLHEQGVADYGKEIQRLQFLLHEDCTELDQNDLNIWHRHFTGLAIKFQIEQDKKPILWNRIHDINKYVHQCEFFTYPKIGKRLKFGDSKMFAISNYNANHDVNNDLVKVNKVCCSYGRFSSSNIFDCFTQSSDYTVWLHEDILGKDQIKTWLDDDDLTEYDCTGNTILTTNITIDPTKFYHRVISDSEFRIASKESGKFVNRPPLGNVVDIENINFDEVERTGKVLAIELDGETLWGNMNKVNKLKSKESIKQKPNMSDKYGTLL